ncbi:histidine kinase [Flavilitoribacter nigricans]|nr:histidine kinase [Flavilitoribacter nigricans]
MKIQNLLFLLLSFAGQLSGQSAPVYPITSEFAGTNYEQERYNDLYDYTEILIDPTGEWTYEDARTRSDQFGPNTTRTDRNVDHIYWVKLRLRADTAARYLFSAGYLYGDFAQVDVYYEHQDSLIRQTAGYQLKAAEKIIRRSGSYFWIDVPADNILTVYLRVDDVTWYCECMQRYPVSIYHIDPQSIMSWRAAYTLPDMEAPEFISLDQETGEMVGRMDKVRGTDNSWLATKRRVVSLVRYFEFYPDTDCNRSLEEVQRDWDNKAFFRGYKRFDFARDTCYWARLEVINPEPFPQTRTFAYAFCRWDRIDYYLPGSDGQYAAHEAFPNANDQKAFTFTIPANDTVVLYIRYPRQTNAYGANGSMVDIHPEDLHRSQQLIRYKYLLAGGMLFFMIYFLLQVIVTREKVMFYYCLLLFGLSPYLLASLNLTPIFEYTQNIFHVSRTLHWISLFVGATLATVGFLKFSQIILDFKTTFPKFNRLIGYILFVECMLGLVATITAIIITNVPNFFSNSTFRLVEKGFNSFNGILMIFIISLAVKAYFRKVPLSGNYLIAILPLAIGVLNNTIVRPYFLPEIPVFLPFIICMLVSLMLYGILIGGQFNRMKLQESRATQKSTYLQNQLLQVESKALRAQMNPHFIFNCLNSIKGLIQETANQQAIHYLTLFSKFIRRVLQHSEEKQISLEEELEMSRLYIEMERLRFEKSFTYKVEIDPAVDTSFFRVPPMILQPILENAIWHGLMHKQGDREIRLEIKAEGEGVKCIVEDNGIGRKQAAALQVNARNGHRSFGTKLILDRLQVNQQLFNHHFVINIIDKIVNGRAAGTRVELSLD